MTTTLERLPRLDSRTLEVFLAVAETGNVSSAAHRLGLTQPAVSRIINRLETQLGSTLLDRQSRPLRLTAAGVVLRERADQFLSDTRDLYAAVRMTTHSTLPHMRLGLVDSFAATVGPSLVQELQQRAEHLSVWSGISPGLDADLLTRALDFVISPDPMEDVAHLARRRVLKEPFVLVMPKEWGAELETTTLDTLAREHTFVRYSERSKIGAQVDQHLRRLRIEPPRRLEFDGTEAVLSMVSGGLGWALTTPLCLLQGEARLRGVRVVPMPAPAIARSLYLIGYQDSARSMMNLIARNSKRILREMARRDIPRIVPWLGSELVIG